MRVERASTSYCSKRLCANCSVMIKNHGIYDIIWGGGHVLSFSQYISGKNASLCLVPRLEVKRIRFHSLIPPNCLAVEHNINKGNRLRPWFTSCCSDRSARSLPFQQLPVQQPFLPRDPRYTNIWSHRWSGAKKIQNNCELIALNLRSFNFVIDDKPTKSLRECEPASTKPAECSLAHPIRGLSQCLKGQYGRQFSTRAREPKGAVRG